VVLFSFTFDWKCCYTCSLLIWGKIWLITFGPTSSRTVTIHNLTFLHLSFFPHAVAMFSPLLCASCILYFSRTNDLSLLSIIFLFTCSIILNMPLVLLSSTCLHVCLFPFLHSWFSFYLFRIPLFLHHPLVWSYLSVSNSISHFLNSDIPSYLPSFCVKNFMCFLLSSYISGHCIFYQVSSFAYYSAFSIANLVMAVWLKFLTPNWGKYLVT